MDILQGTPRSVSIYEVSPRDGLQNEAVTVPTRHKLRLIDALCASGLKRIELTSFVSPRWVPQLADADDVARIATRHAGVTFSALCPNERGLERALATKVDEVAVFVSASESHNRRNVNKTISETLKVFESVVPPAVRQGLKARAYISTVWGCPYEGSVPLEKTLDIAQTLLGLGCYQISLGDTIGVGTPRQTQGIVEAFLQRWSVEQLALHFHDTRGTALANAVVGLALGVSTFDASVGGLGGCPYAPGAAGNCATEDLVYLLHGMGIETGVNAERLWEAGKVAEAVVGRALPGKVHQAGLRSLKT